MKKRFLINRKILEDKVASLEEANSALEATSAPTSGSSSSVPDATETCTSRLTVVSTSAVGTALVTASSPTTSTRAITTLAAAECVDPIILMGSVEMIVKFFECQSQLLAAQCKPQICHLSLVLRVDLKLMVLSLNSG